MIDLSLLSGYIPLIFKLLGIIGSPFLALLIRRWIICHYDLKKTVINANAQIEIERIRAGVSDKPKSNVSSMRIDRDSS